MGDTLRGTVSCARQKEYKRAYDVSLTFALNGARRVWHAAVEALSATRAKASSCASAVWGYESPGTLRVGINGKCESSTYREAST